MKYYFGVDLGGTSAKLALVNHSKKIVKDFSIKTSASASPEKLAKDVAAVFKKIKFSPGQRPQKIGVGVAGDIDVQNGVVRVSPNLGWKNVPLGPLLAKSTGVSIHIDNDANAAAWGIYQTQVPAHIKNVLVVTLGTGVGGGLIINGKLHQGATGSAGEIGHMVMDEEGRRCNCGLKGCLETYAGGTHLVKLAQSVLSQGLKSRLSPLYKKDPNLITPKSIADAAQKKDSLASAIFSHAGHMLGVGLGNLIYVLNPEMIFLTGGVSQSKDLILNPLRKSLKERPFQTPIRAVKIQIAKNPAQVGVIGAALL